MIRLNLIKYEFVLPSPAWISAPVMGSRRRHAREGSEIDFPVGD